MFLFCMISHKVLERQTLRNYWRGSKNMALQFGGLMILQPLLCFEHRKFNDLIHGWGLDMKLGYCAQGDRTEKVGVIDSEYIVHKGIPSLGGASTKMTSSHRTLDLRTQVRRQSTAELEKFKNRWNQAMLEDENWNDPFDHQRRKNSDDDHQSI
ncbi:uncharacterized protein LOC120279593 isoform X1 [Dioscorea cayenensis subsp. rotundata]|uniref:Uncharacterized protein LOC120279593 isoform X1 n=1 Tax=Dioscorea cayennensis subsp. rotundata TaxID=55577 RepID=A0AB40CQU7_DIOCR|nr:uncharacterized protein LOC120279593 isoform X1 [Dioscorea cayenensis subsp. rotundata]